jgi:hypothetical protein
MALTLSADELIMAFENHDSEVRHFLDRQTGEIIFVSDDYEVEDDNERIDENPDRYITIEPVPSHVSFEIMTDFLESLPEGAARRDLAWALNQRKPFRHFKSKLYNYLNLDKQWFRFHEQAFIKIIKEWLKDHKIEATVIPFYKSPPED